ncbi:MAG: secretin N-terminal domain-containing protein [Planctomycetota bacterium]
MADRLRTTAQVACIAAAVAALLAPGVGYAQGPSLLAQPPGYLDSRAASPPPPPAPNQRPTGELRRFPVRHRAARDLAEQVGVMLGPDKIGSVFVSPRSNEVVVQGTPADLAMAAEVIAKLDQPVAGNPPAAKQQQPARLEAYPVGPDKRAAAKAWVASFRGGEGERAAWDTRTGQVILFAPEAAHAAFRSAVQAGGGGAPAARRAQARLTNLSPLQLHARLQQLVSRPLAATWDAQQRWLTFPVQLGTAEGVTLKIDGKSGFVEFLGAPGPAEAWRSVVAALDAAPTGAAESTRFVGKQILKVVLPGCDSKLITPL